MIDSGVGDFWHAVNCIGPCAVAVSQAMYLCGCWDQCVDWSKKAAEATLVYLLGNWRFATPNDDGEIDAEGWFFGESCLNWVLDLQDGLCWAAVGGHWDLVDKLLEFPTDKTGVDSEGRAAHDFYVGLARWHRDPADTAWIEQVKRIRGAGSRGYHQLADFIAAVARRDAAGASAVLSKYVRDFVKKRDYKEQFPFAATFAWHLARRHGVECELPSDVDDLVFRIPESEQAAG